MAKGSDIIDAVRKSRDLIQESIASMYVIGKGDKCVNPTTMAFDNLARSKVLDEIDDAADMLANTIPREFVPANGMMIAYSLENPVGLEDIAVIDNGITFYNGRLRKVGKARYGVPCDASYVLLSLMKYNYNVRALLGVACSENLLDVMEEVGLDVLIPCYGKYRCHCLSDIIIEAIRERGRIPDAFVKKDSEENASIQLLGRNLRDLLNKLRLVL